METEIVKRRTFEKFTNVYCFRVGCFSIQCMDARSNTNLLITASRILFVARETKKFAAFRNYNVNVTLNAP